jgi:transposase
LRPLYEPWAAPWVFFGSSPISAIGLAGTRSSLLVCCYHLRPVDLDGLEVNGRVEFAIQKGHRYTTAIVFDMFHVVAMVGREVIDRVRVDRANERRADRRSRRIIKGARWLLLKNRDLLRPGEDVKRDELLAAKVWISWYRKVLRSGMEPLRRFAKALRPCLPGSLAHCRYPLGPNLIEGINNKIMVIKCMACGFRADADDFLKIEATFPEDGCRAQNIRPPYCPEKQNNLLIIKETYR